MPSDVPDWIQRRNEASRAAPRPIHRFFQADERHHLSLADEVDEDLYELDAGPAAIAGGRRNDVPRTMDLGGYVGQDLEAGHHDEYGNSDEDLAKAIELSMTEHNGSVMGRSSTGDFDEDQMKEAMSRSLFTVRYA